MIARIVSPDKQRRSQGRQGGGCPPNNEKVGDRETLKSAIQSIDWKIAPKQQVQLLSSV